MRKRIVLFAVKFRVVFLEYANAAAAALRS
jgi:hypothetical protein